MEYLKQISKNNILIAEFMGFEWYEINTPFTAVRDLNGVRHFATNWDDLMLLVEKIENITIQKLSFSFNIQKDRVSLFYSHINEPKKQIEMYFEWGQKTKIANTYKIAVEFIKWYNKQNK
jgi:hypothetical protein